MVEMGLVVKDLSLEDKRSVKISITSKGVKMNQKCTKIVAKVQNEFLSILTNNQKNELISSLKLLLSHYSD